MREHVHVVSAPFAKNVSDEHQEWLASGEPCVLCGERRKFLSDDAARFHGAHPSQDEEATR